MASIIIQKIADTVRELRLFSISAFIFVCYEIDRVITHTLTNELTMEVSAANGGTLLALVGLCKFIFEFAIRKREPDSKPPVDIP